MSDGVIFFALVWFVPDVLNCGTAVPPGFKPRSTYVKGSLGKTLNPRVLLLSTKLAPCMAAAAIN